jgi:hypothetical protein
MVILQSIWKENENYNGLFIFRILHSKEIQQSISDWRISNTIPEKRLLQFQVKEGSIDPKELFKNIYN